MRLYWIQKHFNNPKVLELAWMLDLVEAPQYVRPGATCAKKKQKNTTFPTKTVQTAKYAHHFPLSVITRHRYARLSLSMALKFITFKPSQTWCRIHLDIINRRRDGHMLNPLLILRQIDWTDWDGGSGSVLIIIIIKKRLNSSLTNLCVRLLCAPSS